MRRRAVSFVFACPPSPPVQLTCTLTQDGSDHSMNAVGLHQALREQLTTETPQPAWSRCGSCTAAAPAAWRGLKTQTPHMLVLVTFLVLNTVNHAVFVCLPVPLPPGGRLYSHAEPAIYHHKIYPFNWRSSN